MITVVGIWERGFSDEQMLMEWRMWKQTIEAFAVDRWIMVGQGPSKCGRFESFDKMDDALDTTVGKRIFLVPGAFNHRIPRFYYEDPVYVFGNASDNLRKYIDKADFVVGIETPEPVDMFAACCLPLVLAA